MVESAEKIIETLKTVDNEGTESPYWLIIDPSAVVGYLVGTDEETGKPWKSELEKEDLRRISDAVPNCITGPFFSREDAQAHLTARNYAFSTYAYVYCHSGYWSQKYKALCREIKVGKNVSKT